MPENNSNSDPTLSTAPQSADSERMCDIIVEALDDAGGEQIAVLDVSALTDITDFMVVVTGNSDRHVKTLSSRLLEAMHDAGFAYYGVEGEESRNWILVDFIDVVVHVMRDQTRKRYDLESLWSKTFSEMKKQGSAAEIMSESA